MILTITNMRTASGSSLKPASHQSIARIGLSLSRDDSAHKIVGTWGCGAAQFEKFHDVSRGDSLPNTRLKLTAPLLNESGGRPGIRPDSILFENIQVRSRSLSAFR